MIEQPYVTRSEWKKHTQTDWKRAHNLWRKLKGYVPGWGYSQAEIDAFFEGEASGKKQVHWDRVTNKPSTYAPSAHATTHELGGGDIIDSLGNLYISGFLYGNEAGDADLNFRNQSAASEIFFRNSAGAVISSITNEMADWLIGGQLGIGGAPNYPLDVGVDGGSGFFGTGANVSCNIFIAGTRGMFGYDGVRCRIQSNSKDIVLVADNGAFGSGTVAFRIVATNSYARITQRLRIGDDVDPVIPLQVVGGSDVSLSAGTGYVIIGVESGENIVIDTNEIQARNNGVAAVLYLNNEGGQTYMGGNVQIASIAAGVSDYDKFLVSDSGVIKFRTGAQVLADIGAVSDVHATRHQSGGADSIRLDDLASPEDNADLNVTVSLHGLFPKLPGASFENYHFSGTGSWNQMAGSGAYTIKVLSIVSANVRNSNDTERSTDATSYEKLKEVRLNEPTGAITLAWEHRSEDGVIVYSRMYINGSPVGSVKSTTNTSYVTVTQSLAAQASGALIQIYGYHSVGGGDSIRVRNMRFRYDRAISQFGDFPLSTALPVTVHTAFSMTNQDP
jgi:hypothetical protein